MPLILSLRRQKAGGQPGLRSVFQDSPSYRVRPSLKRTNKQVNQAATTKKKWWFYPPATVMLRIFFFFFYVENLEVLLGSVNLWRIINHFANAKSIFIPACRGLIPPRQKDTDWISRFSLKAKRGTSGRGRWALSWLVCSIWGSGWYYDSHLLHAKKG